MDPKNRAEWDDWQDKRFLTGKYASTSTAAGYPAAGPAERLKTPKGEPAWVQEIRNQQATVLRVELYRHLDTMTAGQRIRMLRTVRGWTQQRAAVELGVNRRTVIRHEHGEHQPQFSLWERLRDLESAHAELLVLSFGRH